MSSCQKQKMLRQACVIPYRQGDNGQWEVCLVTSIRKRRWIFPKGLVDKDETIAESGMKEAWEEAGVHGHVVGPVVAQYTDYKWGAQLDVDVMKLRVTDVAQQWPEDHLRQRRWCSVAECGKLLHKRVLRELLENVKFS